MTIESLEMAQGEVDYDYTMQPYPSQEAPGLSAWQLSFPSPQRSVSLRSLAHFLVCAGDDNKIAFNRITI